MTETTELLEFAIDIAKRAGLVMIEGKGRPSPIWTSTTHAKTVADDTNDRMTRAAIAIKFPDHNILSEESDPLERGSEYIWVIDGVDGTFGLISPFSDHVAFCMALCCEGIPIVGVINAARRNELYYAMEGAGTFLNGEPIHAADTTDLTRVSMSVDSGKHHTDRMPPITQKLTLAGVNCALGTNCASVPIALAAREDSLTPAYAATSLEPEDMAAGVIINREAGNRVTNLQGEEWQLGDEGILIANLALHEKLLRIILG